MSSESLNRRITTAVQRLTELLHTDGDDAVLSDVRQELNLVLGALERAHTDLHQGEERVTVNDHVHPPDVIDREHKSEFEFYYDTAPVGLAILDTDLRFLQINEGLAEINGLPAAEHIGRIVREVVPDLADQAEPLFRQVIATGEPVLDLEIKGTTAAQPDVERTWLESYYPLKDADGQVTRINVVVQDITRRKQAEATLREALEQRHMALEAGQLGIWDYDLATNTVHWDERARTIFGMPESRSASLEQVISMIHPDDRADALAAFEAALASDSSNTYQQEKRVVWPDGSVHWIITRGRMHRDINDGQDRATRCIGVVMDITERKHAEETLREQNARLALLSQVAADLLAARDPDVLIQELFHTIAVEFGLDVSFNFTVTEDGTGLQLDAYVGIGEQDAQDIEYLEFGEAVCGTVAQNCESMCVPAVQETDTPLVALIKSYGVRAYACYPLMVEDRLLGTLSFGTRNRDRFSEADLTFFHMICQYVAMAKARLQAEAALRERTGTLEERVVQQMDELQQANRLLTRRNRELQDFAYVASHDLQEPLRKIRAFGNLLHSKYSDRLDENGQLYIDRMQNAAKRMSTLLEDLLAFSRVATHGNPFKPVDLSEIARTVVADLDLAIEEAGARVEIGSLPTIEADPRQVRRLLHNLIDNAIRFRDPERTSVVTVYVTVSGVDHRYNDSQIDAGETCILVVEDNGIGLEEKYRDRIFDPFQRLHGRTKYSGTGMGLAISRRIVERHGGTIDVESTPGEGSRFMVTLPVHQRHQLPSARR